jgi:hypothetical protein
VKNGKERTLGRFAETLGTLTGTSPCVPARAERLYHFATLDVMIYQGSRLLIDWEKGRGVGCATEEFGGKLDRYKSFCHATFIELEAPW